MSLSKDITQAFILGGNSRQKKQQQKKNDFLIFKNKNIQDISESPILLRILYILQNEIVSTVITQS